MFTDRATNHNPLHPYPYPNHRRSQFGHPVEATPVTELTQRIGGGLSKHHSIEHDAPVTKVAFTIQKPFTEQVRKNLLIIYIHDLVNTPMFIPRWTQSLLLGSCQTLISILSQISILGFKTTTSSVVFISHLKTQNSNNQNRIANARRPSVSNHRKKVHKYFYF
ncbi:hypothetical protein C8Q75DRAFT_809954 [Abortiporus biennis]|nr:hypothetical protein C8Q75DRAFT_809954 [Abortiporus biennis]